MSSAFSQKTLESVSELEKLEKKNCNLHLVFAEMFKDEINANDEHKLYNGVKRVIKKYSGDKNALTAINEFTRVISGGTSLEEIIEITKDEAINPTIASDLMTDRNCGSES